MRLPRLSPSVERRSPVRSPAGPPGGALGPQWLEAILSGQQVTFLLTVTGCLLKHCSTSNDCANNGACTTCTGGICQN
jgi:hypothetical protein